VKRILLLGAPSRQTVRYKGRVKQSQDKVLTGGGDLRSAQVVVLLSVSHSRV
jgi:molybdopterin biosynthesis enzyme